MDHFDEITRDIRASDHRAFTTLYDATHRDLLKYAWHITHNEELMYDIVQEAFTTLWDRRHTLDIQKSVRALLFRIVRNIAFKTHRKKNVEIRQELVLPDSAKNNGPAHYDESVIRLHLENILSHMPERRREVFELSRLGLLKHSEIAALMDITPKTVRNHLVAALKHIRAQFEQLGIGQKSL